MSLLTVREERNGAGQAGRRVEVAAARCSSPSRRRWCFARGVAVHRETAITHIIPLCVFIFQEWQGRKDTGFVITDIGVSLLASLITVKL